MVSKLNRSALARNIGTSLLEPKIREFHEYLRARLERRIHVPSRGKVLIQGIGEALVESSWEPPVDPMRIAFALNANVEVLQRAGHSQLGKLLPVRGGFRLVVYGDDRVVEPAQGEFGPEFESASSLTSRGRFTLAHELGHTLFYTRPRQPSETPERVTPADGAREAHWREEGLCHEFARALLVPSVAKSLVDPTPSTRAITAATRLFRVSREVLIRRALHDWNLWSETSFLHVSFFGDRVRAQLLHGSAARRRAGSAVGGADQLRAVRQKATPRELLPTIESLFRCSRDDMLVYEKEVWAILR